MINSRNKSFNFTVIRLIVLAVGGGTEHVTNVTPTLNCKAHTATIVKA